MILKISRERSVVARCFAGLERLSPPLGTRWPTEPGGTSERRREVVDDRIEERLHALVLERRPAQDGTIPQFQIVALRTADMILVLGRSRAPSRY